MRELTLYILCVASMELWTKDFDDLSPEHQKLFEDEKIPCAESGTLGQWCKGCQFGEVTEDEQL